jgi:hypothetical protein
MQVQYSVTARLRSRTDLEEYLGWLETDHLRKVLDAGALNCTLLLPDSDDGTFMVRCQYTFESRDCLNRYVREQAPRLRQEGLERFPPERGVVFTRETASVRISM